MPLRRSGGGFDDLDERRVLLDVAARTAARLGVLIDLHHFALDQLVLEGIDANRHRQAGPHERDAGFVHRGLDLHLVRAAGRRMITCRSRTDGTGFDDELGRASCRATRVVLVGIDHLAGDAGPDRALADLVLDVRQLVLFELPGCSSRRRPWPRPWRCRCRTASASSPWCTCAARRASTRPTSSVLRALSTASCSPSSCKPLKQPLGRQPLGRVERQLGAAERLLGDEHLRLDQLLFLLEGPFEVFRCGRSWPP